MIFTKRCLPLWKCLSNKHGWYGTIPHTAWETRTIWNTGFKLWIQPATTRAKLSHNRQTFSWITSLCPSLKWNLSHISSHNSSILQALQCYKTLTASPSLIVRVATWLTNNSRHRTWPVTLPANPSRPMTQFVFLIPLAKAIFQNCPHFTIMCIWKDIQRPIRPCSLILSGWEALWIIISRLCRGWIIIQLKTVCSTLGI